MQIPPEVWSQEDEKKDKKLWIHRRLANHLPIHEKSWLEEVKVKREELIASRTRRMTERPMEQRLHYRWIEFYRKTMEMAAEHNLEGRKDLAAWLILLETELQALRDWNPALTRAHTLRRHGFLALRAEFIMRALNTKDSKTIIINKDIDLTRLPRDERKWELLWTEKKNRCAEIFPVLSPESEQVFREEVTRETYELTYYCYPGFPSHHLRKRYPSESD